MQIVYSNAHEALFEQLYQKIKLTGGARNLLIFPSQALKSFYSDLLCEKMGSTLSLDLILPDEIYEISYELGGSDPRQLWQPSWKLYDYQWVLLQILMQFQNDPEDENYKKWILGSPLAFALNQGSEAAPVIASHLASLFFQYSQWALLPECFSKTITDWQSFLWARVHEVLDPKHTLACQWLALADLNRPFYQETAIHLIGFSQACPGFLKWVEAMAKFQPVIWYVHSPSRLYWHDLESYLRGQRKLSKLVASTQTHDQLEALLLDRNPLLASLCQVAKPLMQYLEENQNSSIDAYHLFADIESVPFYQDLWWEELSCSKEKLSLLKAIQTDLLLMRSVHESSEILLHKDESLKIYNGTTQSQEVEFVKNAIIEILSKEEDVSLSDIMVLSPEIHLYRGFIEHHFDPLFDKIPYKILDTTKSDETGAKAFVKALLKVSTSAWSWENILELLQDPWIQKEASGREISYWLREVAFEKRVSFGVSKAHREHLAKQNAWHVDEESSFDDTGTWQHFWFYAFEKGLLEEGQSSFNTIENHSYRAARLLLGSLEKNLFPWISGALLSPLEWMRALKCSLSEIVSDKENTFSFLDDFSKRLENYSCDPVFGKDFNKLLQEFLEEKPTYWSSNKEGLLRFASLQPMRALPVKHLFILGLAAHQFPTGNPGSDYEWSINDLVGVRPKASEIYRFAFLESLLSARKSLCLTYSDQENVKGQPCAILANLLAYIRIAFGNEGEGSDEIVPFYKRDSFTDQDLKRLDLELLNEYKPALESIGKKEISLFEVSWALRDPLRFYLYHRFRLSQKEESFESKEISIIRPYLDTISRISKMDQNLCEEVLIQEWKQSSISHLEADIWTKRLIDHRLRRQDELFLDLQEPVSLYLSPGRRLLSLKDEIKEGSLYCHSKEIQAEKILFEIKGLTQSFDLHKPQIVIKDFKSDSRASLMKALPSLILFLDLGLIKTRVITLVPTAHNEAVREWDLSDLDTTLWLKTLARYMEKAMSSLLFFTEELHSDLFKTQTLESFDDILCSQIENDQNKKYSNFAQQYMWGVYCAKSSLWKKCVEQSYAAVHSDLKFLWSPLFKACPMRGSKDV